MHINVLFAALSAASSISALPSTSLPLRAEDARDVNPFLGKSYFANSYYAGELNQTVNAFLAKNDSLNAARTRTVQKTGTFVWITSVAGLSNIQTTIDAARTEQQRTRNQQIVELVLYDLPDRDCSGGQSGGEFSSANDGLNLYKKTFVDPYAAALKAARDLTFAVILEPDSLGNVITNQDIPFCANATSTYEQGIAYAIAKLQAPNIALYIDAAHGGWLGWDGNLAPAAAEFAKVVQLAQNLTLGSAGAQIRGFSTDVSNFNPYIADPRANYTQYSNAYDELHYAEVLAPHLANNSLPAHFIIDQGRSGLQNTRTTWGEWCNVEAGFGIPPTTDTNSTLVDSIVWAKPGGESDGACGPAVDGDSAPGAGLWWEAYAEELVRNADPPLPPTYAAL
ncbi:1,4-beta-D-glucan cellobiohydrolase CEL6B, partial [Lachnellula cervina]